MAGSTKIGEYCAFGGQSGAIDNVTIGDRAIFACYTAVTKDLPGGKMYSGAPAREIKEKNKRDYEQAKVVRYNNQDIWTIRNEMNAITRYMTRFRKKRGNFRFFVFI